MAIRAELELGTRNFNANLDAATRRVRERANEMRSATQGIGGSLGGGVSAGLASALRLLGPAGVAYGAFRTAVSATQVAMERANAEMALAAVSGEDLESQLERLSQAAEAPGLEFDAMVRGSTRLQAVGMSAEQAEAAMREFGNALALVGGGADQLDGILLAITQIYAKGVVSAEEINQIAERMPQIRALMQDAFGTADTQALQKMGIGAEDFIDAMVESASKLERAQDTTANSLKNLKQDWLNFLQGAGDDLQDPLRDALGLLKDMLSVAGDLYLVTSNAVKQIPRELKGMSAEDAEIVSQFVRQGNAGLMPADGTRKAAEEIVDKSWRARALTPDEQKAEAERQAKLRAEFEKKAERLADEKEREILRGREEQARERERQMEEVARLREDNAAGAFALLSPDQQAAELRRQLSASLGTQVDSWAIARIGMDRLARRADEFREAGDIEGEAEVRQRLAAAQGQFSRLVALSDVSALPGGAAAAEMGSVARLVNQVMGRDPQQQAVEELRRSNDYLRDQRDALDEILEKMDEPPPRDVFGESEFARR